MSPTKTEVQGSIVWVWVLQKREPRITGIMWLISHNQWLKKPRMPSTMSGDYFIGVIGEMLEAISWASEVVAANEPQSLNSGGGKIIYLKWSMASNQIMSSIKSSKQFKPEEKGKILKWKVEFS